VDSDIFGPGSNCQKRFIKDYEELSQRVKACRQLGLKVVLTSGTFDLLHVGHSRYLENAKRLADGGILVVGVDSDAKVKKRKGPDRPIVAEDERVEILCHLRHVDLVTLKPAEAARWSLIELVRPDILQVTQEEYSEDKELTQLKEFCAGFGCQVMVLEPQATTSTTARIRLLLIDFKNALGRHLDDFEKVVLERIRELRVFQERM
jgi:D-beta-D-heptose 7-phosphate kinase/D-beta-D-heptose 1-phosphate adenosyltransferase